MGILDELLGDGRGALAEGERGDILERRLADAEDVEPAVVVKALVLNGDKGLGKVRRKFVVADAPPRGVDGVSRTVQELHLRRGEGELALVELHPRRRNEGVEDKGEERGGEDCKKDEKYFSGNFHFPQYALFCKKIAGKERHKLKYHLFCDIIDT